MRSVVVARYVPWPANSGDKQRTLAVLRALRTRGEVTVCALAGPDEDGDGLREQGFDVRCVAVRRSPATLAHGLFRSGSLTGARFWSAGLDREVRRAVARGCDVLVLEHVQSTMYAARYAATEVGPARVVDMHNIESALAARVGRSERGLRRAVWTVESLLLRRLERRVRDSDVVAVVSAADRETLAAIRPHPGIVVAPNGWDAARPLPASTAPVVGFVALLSWGPNVSAAQWFAQQVWPHVLASIPEATLLLVGRNPTDAVRALAREGVVVTGTVPDLEPWYRSTMVCVAPLLAGGGSRLKILEGLAAGRPVVATTIGVEGLEDLVGRGVVVADHPAEMARVLVELLSDPETTAALGREGAGAVDADHSWDATLRPLLEAVEATTPLGRGGRS